MIREAFEKIAGENRTTPSEVLKEIQTAIDIGNSSDPFIRARRHKLGFFYKPTPEEFIIAVAMVITD